MTLAETVRDAINKEHMSGMTQQQIADRHNVSRSYIQSLLTGRCPYEGITLDSLQKMFPHAILGLNRTITTRAFSSNNADSSLGQQKKTADVYRQEAVAAIIKLNISGDAMKEVLYALMNIEVEVDTE